jgi:two-component system sensor histidine kinase ChiS
MRVIDLKFDKNRIEQVVRNLISNAIKHSDGKEINITVEEKDSHVLVCVKDFGIGIPENELESIFLPFTQSSRKSPSDNSSGLGLALCADIMKYHNGKIWAVNNADGSSNGNKRIKGATFCFTLPINLPKTLPNNLTDSVDAKSTNECESFNVEHKYKVLFVDDDKFCEVSARIMIESEGMEMVSASCVSDALMLLQKDKFDIIILDLLLPDGNGVDVAKKIRQLASLNRSVPIMLQSGIDNSQDWGEIGGVGINGAILKPYTKQILIQKIYAILKMSTL